MKAEACAAPGNYFVTCQGLAVRRHEAFDMKALHQSHIGQVREVADPRLFLQPIRKASAIKREDRPPRRALRREVDRHALKHLGAHDLLDDRIVGAECLDCAVEDGVAVDRPGAARGPID
jgi:hypothetical protein